MRQWFAFAKLSWHSRFHYAYNIRARRFSQPLCIVQAQYTLTVGQRVRDLLNWACKHTLVRCFVSSDLRLLSQYWPRKTFCCNWRSSRVLTIEDDPGDSKRANDDIFFLLNAYNIKSYIIITKSILWFSASTPQRYLLIFLEFMKRIKYWYKS